MRTPRSMAVEGAMFIETAGPINDQGVTLA
jgi:hypothetical protein